MAMQFDLNKKVLELKEYYLKEGEYDYKTNSYVPYTDRRALNLATKKALQIQSLITQPEINSIDITIEWKKSRTWGANPHLTAYIHTADNCRVYTCTCSGCGYDKESTVIADLFNNCLKYKLFELQETSEQEKMPYGINLNIKTDRPDAIPFFDGGIGTDCYKAISEKIGGKFERVASGKTFDAYCFTMMD